MCRKRTFVIVCPGYHPLHMDHPQIGPFARLLKPSSKLSDCWKPSRRQRQGQSERTCGVGTCDEKVWMIVRYGRRNRKAPLLHNVNITIHTFQKNLSVVHAYPSQHYVEVWSLIQATQWWQGAWQDYRRISNGVPTDFHTYSRTRDRKIDKNYWSCPGKFFENQGFEKKRWGSPRRQDPHPWTSVHHRIRWSGNRPASDLQQGASNHQGWSIIQKVFHESVSFASELLTHSVIVYRYWHAARPNRTLARLSLRRQHEQPRRTADRVDQLLEAAYLW